MGLDELLGDLLGGHHRLHESLQSLHRKVDLIMSSTDQVLTGLSGLSDDLTVLGVDVNNAAVAIDSLEKKIASTPGAPDVSAEMTAIRALHTGFADLHSQLSAAVATTSTSTTGPVGDPTSTEPGTIGGTGPVTPVTPVATGTDLGGSEPGTSAVGTPITPPPGDASTTVPGDTVTPAPSGDTTIDPPVTEPPLAGTTGPGGSVV